MRTAKLKGSLAMASSLSGVLEREESGWTLVLDSSTSVKEGNVTAVSPIDKVVVTVGEVKGGKWVPNEEALRPFTDGTMAFVSK